MSSFPWYDSSSEINLDNKQTESPSSRKLTSREKQAANTVQHDSPTIDDCAYHGLIGQIIKEIEPTTEAAPVALLVQLLIGCGSIIGRTAHTVADGHKHYLNLFGVLVGKSFSARKGTSWSRIREVLLSVDEDWVKQRVRSGLVSAEGMAHEVRDPVYGIPPGKPRNSATPGQEILLDPGISDKRLFCYESEFASVLRHCDRPGNTLSTRIREAWDSHAIGSMAKNSQTRCLEPHISINGHITVDDLIRHLGSIDIVNGFGNRFLWIYVCRSKSLPHGADYHSNQRLISDLIEVIHWAQSVGRINRDNSANRLWEQVYDDLTSNKPGRYGCLLERAAPQVLRLSSLYAVLDHSLVVRADHLQAALALWSYCEQSVYHIFGCKVGDKTADKILQELQKGRELDRTDLMKLFNNNKDSETITQALLLLQSQGLAKSEVLANTGGGPREVWKQTKRTK